MTRIRTRSGAGADLPDGPADAGIIPPTPAFSFTHARSSAGANVLIAHFTACAHACAHEAACTNINARRLEHMRI